jgi:hypothetical protein
MHSPDSLVHSIYGKDKSSNNLHAAILSQPSAANSLRINSPQEQTPIVNTTPQSSQIILQNSLTQKPQTQSQIDSFLEIQKNQINELNKLNEKLLRDTQQLNLLQSGSNGINGANGISLTNSSNLLSSSNLVSSSSQPTLSSDNILKFSSPIQSENIPSVLTAQSQTNNQQNIIQTTQSQLPQTLASQTAKINTSIIY